MVTKILAADELLELLQQGGWYKSFPEDCPKKPSRTRILLNVVKKCLANNVWVIQYGEWEIDGPVGHIPLTSAMEFRHISPFEIEVWKKGTLRYNLKRK